MLKKLMLIPIVLIAIIAVYSSIYVVKSGEEVVIERFGAVTKVEKTSGLKFKLPIIDRMTKLNTMAVHSMQYGFRLEEEGTTKNVPTYSDNNEEAVILTMGSYILNVEAIIQYTISDAVSYLYNVDDQQGTIRLAFESVLRRNFQNKQMDDALVNKDVISSEIFPELTKKLNSYGLGIILKSVEIQNITVPNSVRSAYDEVNNAKNKKSELLDNAKKYQNERLPGARAEAYKMVQGAEAYSASKVSQAKGDTENFRQVYDEYKSSKDITRTRLYLETMEKILMRAKNKKIYDFDSNGVIKYLPLNPSSQTQKGGN